MIPLRFNDFVHEVIIFRKREKEIQLKRRTRRQYRELENYKVRMPASV